MRVVYNSYSTVCPSVPEIIHSLKLANYLLTQANKPWYKYYMESWKVHQQLSTVSLGTDEYLVIGLKHSVSRLLLNKGMLK